MGYKLKTDTVLNNETIEIERDLGAFGLPQLFSNAPRAHFNHILYVLISGSAAKETKSVKGGRLSK